MQGTLDQFLVWEDPTCLIVTQSVHHSHWAGALESTRCNYWARELQLLKPRCLEPMLRNKSSHHNEKPVYCKKEYPPLTATRESLRTTTKTHHSQKRKEINKSFFKKKKIFNCLFFSEEETETQRKLKDSFTWQSASIKTEPHFLLGSGHPKGQVHPQLWHLIFTPHCLKAVWPFKATSVVFTASKKPLSLDISSGFLQQAASSQMGTHHCSKMQHWAFLHDCLSI